MKHDKATLELPGFVVPFKADPSPEPVAQRDPDLPVMYPHQTEWLGRIRTSIARHRAVIAGAPPGVGKTRLAKWMLASFAQKEARGSGKAVFAVHRRTLVDNASNSFLEAPELPHGLMMAGCETAGGNAIQVASIDTLLSWYCEGGHYDNAYTFDFVVFDECHSHHSKLQTFLTAHNKKRKQLGLFEPYVLGLSATPQANGLGDVYQEICLGPSTEWLVDNEYLVPYRYFTGVKGDLSKLKPSGDNFTEPSVSAAMSGLTGDLFRDWKRIAGDRPTVAFFPRLKHAKEAQAEFLSQGIKAAYVDGKTPDQERRDIFAAMGDGSIQYLANVGVVERGTDIPSVGCVQLATAVGSVVRYFQMIGRGSRTCEGKEDCIVIDHGGNVARLGFFDDEVEWSLDWSSRPSKDHEARPTVECPGCGAMYRGGRCKECGYEPTVKERKAQKLEFVDGELVELKKKVKAPRKKTCRQIMVDCLYMAGNSNQNFRQALRLCYIAAEKQGGTFRVPRDFSVAGKTYRPIPRGSGAAKIKVADTYPFTVGNHSYNANIYQVGEVDR